MGKKLDSGEEEQKVKKKNKGHRLHYYSNTPSYYMGALDPFSEKVMIPGTRWWCWNNPRSSTGVCS